MNFHKPKTNQAFSNSYMNNKSKLVSRFNVSLNSSISSTHNNTHRHEHGIYIQQKTSRLNTSKQMRQPMNTSRQLKQLRQSKQPKTQKEPQDLLSRYQNHIMYLQSRATAFEANIHKQALQIQSQNAVIQKLTKNIGKLQHENKTLLDSLYKAQNKITQIEERHNNQMLHQSIKRIESELSASQIQKQGRRRHKTLEDLEGLNPESAYSMAGSVVQFGNTSRNQLVASMRNSQWISEVDEFVVKNRVILSIDPQVFHHQIRPSKNSSNNIAVSKRSSINQHNTISGTKQNINRSLFQTQRQKQKQRQYEINQSSKIQQQSIKILQIQRQQHKKLAHKLQEAIYYLKKQLKEQEKRYIDEINLLKIELQENRMKFDNIVEEMKLKQANKLKNIQERGQQTQQLIIQQKQLQAPPVLQHKISQIEQIYSNQLRQVENKLEQAQKFTKQLEFLVLEKNQEIQTLLEENKQLESQMKQLQNQILSINAEIALWKSKYEEIYGIAKGREEEIQNLKHQINNNILPTINKSQSIAFQKGLELVLSDEKLQQKQQQQEIQKYVGSNFINQNINENLFSLQLSHSIKVNKAINNQVSNIKKHQKHKIHLVCQYTNNTFIAQYSGILLKLQQLSLQKSKAEKLLNQKTEDCHNKIEELEEQKIIFNSQTQKLQRLVRKLQGDLAEKDVFVNEMTEQMLLIKQKLEVEKMDKQSQVESINDSNGVYSGEEGHPQVTDNTPTPETLECLHNQFHKILTQTTQTHSKELQHSQSLCQHFEKQLQRCQQKLYEKQEQVQSLKNRIQEFEESIIIKDQELQECKDEIGGLKERVGELEGKIGFYEEYVRGNQQTQGMF